MHSNHIKQNKQNKHNKQNNQNKHNEHKHDKQMNLSTYVNQIFQFKRRNYICGTNTPLFRGIIHIILSFYLSYHSPYNFNSMSGYIGNLILLSGNIVSIAYHDVYSPKYENLLRKLDHVFVNLRPIGIYLLAVKYCLATQICIGILLSLWLLTSANILFKKDYILSKQYTWIYGIISLVILMFSFLFNNLSYLDLFCICGIYIFAILNYVYSTYKNMKIKKDSSIWGNHETFHLAHSLADYLLVQNNLST